MRWKHRKIGVYTHSQTIDLQDWPGVAGRTLPLTEALETLSQDGWEMVAATAVSHRGMPDQWLYFKRPVED
jgi:hypothetical protein